MSKINLPAYPVPHPVAGHRMFSASQVEAHVKKAVREALAAQVSALHAFADRKYCIAIEYARRNEALGWESKVKNGRFGVDEYACHKNMNEAYGAHFGIYEALKQVAIIPEKDHGEPS
ncbi:MAG: hypothetical protein K0S02_562 [Achromobacter mucicolens]|jgi:hypothetical protein|uniref:hypothetical protein n=1 Tax=Achromobacter mucicolens TaxID=1389922 RepID=UPI00242DEA66|nr:hypothetical protein [Achromobacter mucicolens]MDF2860290.1 hypothetical protein [Achromobacter mucicolens]